MKKNIEPILSFNDFIKINKINEYNNENLISEKEFEKIITKTFESSLWDFWPDSDVIDDEQMYILYFFDKKYSKNNKTTVFVENNNTFPYVIDSLLNLDEYQNKFNEYEYDTEKIVDVINNNSNIVYISYDPRRKSTYYCLREFNFSENKFDYLCDNWNINKYTIYDTQHKLDQL